MEGRPIGHAQLTYVKVRLGPEVWSLHAPNRQCTLHYPDPGQRDLALVGARFRVRPDPRDLAVIGATVGLGPILGI